MYFSDVDIHSAFASYSFVQDTSAVNTHVQDLTHIVQWAASTMTSPPTVTNAPSSRKRKVTYYVMESCEYCEDTNANVCPHRTLHPPTNQM